MPDRIIRHRPQRRLGRQRAFATCAMVFVAAASALGCELVIGDAPPKKSTGPALAEAGTTPPEVSSSGGAPGAGGTFGTGGATGSGGVIPHGGAAGSAGASTGGVSSGTGGSGNAGVGGRDLRDAGLPPPDAKVPDAAPPSCTTAVTWYQDDDRDGYGTGVSMEACPAPAGSWALATGDCNDQNPAVNPGQKKFFGAPYKKSDDTDSFDYDCSGVEDPNPSLTLAPDDCGLLMLALCGSASGYEKNNRAGFGLNPWCGSTTVRVCNPMALLCTTTERTDQPPFSCR